MFFTMSRHILKIFITAFVFIPKLSATLPPYDPFANNSLLETSPSPRSENLQPRAAKAFYLRIATLGASITNGYLSSDENGYRKYLRDQLRLE